MNNHYHLLFFLRYGSDPSFSLDDKNKWKRDTKNRRDDHDNKLKKLINDAKMKTAENSADYAEAGTVLAYNPVRCKEVTRHLLKLDKFAEIKNDLAHLDSEEVMSKYDEVEMRKALLLEGLITTGGKRPGTIAAMRVGELLKGTRLDDGCVCVAVRKHKTFQKYGVSLLTFYRDNLYEAYCNYLKIFR